MSAPLVPSPLDYIGRRTFAFYPAIRPSPHKTFPNSWILGARSWGEVQVINSQTGSELWMPRQYIGAVSDQQSALVVGLTEHMELRDGQVVPRSERRVIQMPLPPDGPLSRRGNGPAKVVGIRLESMSHATFQNTPFRVGIFVLFVAGLLALVATASR